MKETEKDFFSEWRQDKQDFYLVYQSHFLVSNLSMQLEFFWKMSMNLCFSVS